MRIRNFLTQKEELNINGRIIRIYWKNPLVLLQRKKVLSEIKVFAETNKLAKLFPKINIVLAKDKSGVKHNKKGLFIYLGFPNKNIQNTLTQKIAQLWQESNSKVIPKAKQENEKLKKELSSISKKKKIKNKHQSELLKLRLVLRTMVTQTIQKGFSLFYLNYQNKQIKFSDEEFVALHESSKRKMRTSIYILSELLVRIEKGEELYPYNFFFEQVEKETIPTIIGFMVIYSILFLDKDMTMEKITKIKTFKLIRYYEKLVLRKNIQPLLSISSGTGMFDYKRYVDRLNRIYQQLEK